MKTAILLFSFLQFSNLVWAQSPAIQWQNSLGGTQQDRLQAAQQTADGGYILGGTSNSNATGDKTENCLGFLDFWVVKLNASGGIAWQNTIGGSGMDDLQSIQQTTDGGYILGGYSLSNASGDKSENNLGGLDYWVVKLDAAGNLVWENTIGGSGHDHLQSVCQTSDGGFLLGGYSESNISGDKTEASIGSYDYWIVKLNASGNIVWQNTIGGESFDELWAIQPASDGGFWLGGSSVSGVSGDKTEANFGNFDYWLVKVNDTGTPIGQKTIGGSGNDFVRAMAQTSAGDVLLSGFSDSNISGNKTENSQGGRDYWVVKLSGTTIVWQNTLGGSDWDESYALAPTADGGFFIGGTSVSSTSGDKTEDNQGDYDFWVLKLGSECPINFSLTITPQPCLAKTKITASTPTGGTAPYTYKLNGGSYQTSKIFTVNQSGNYTITVKDANNCTAAQIVAVTVAPLLVATVSKTNVTCFGAANGTASASATGGTAPYNFQWKMGASVVGTGQSIGNLVPGNYQLIATDAQNCSKTAKFSITQPASALALNLHSILPQGANFKVRLTATGGTSGAKMYRRCDPNGNNCTAWQTSYTFQNVPAGTYQFQVKDAANCTATLNTAVPQAKPAQNREQATEVLTPNLEVKIYPNPATDVLQIHWEGAEKQTGQVQLLDLFGKIVFEESIDLLPVERQTVSLEQVEAGTYFLRIWTAAGITYSGRLIVF